MKVAIIDPLGAHGGLHYFTDGMARGLQHAGVDTTVFTLYETGKSGNEPYRVVLAFRGLYGRESAVRRGLRFIRGIIGAVIAARLAGIRLVHIHCFHGNFIEQLSALLVCIMGMKLVVTLHDIESFGDKGVAGGRERILRLVSAVIVLNNFCLEQFRRVTGGAGPSAFVVPSGHYIDNFPVVPARTASRKSLGLPQDCTIFLFFGNSRLEKGLDLLLRAMASLRSEKGVMLLVAGKMKPEQEAFYQAIIAEERIAHCVRMDVGHVSDEGISAYYSAADLVVVPYRRIYDSAVTLMAMSFGRAILASDLPPLADILGDGRYGLLFANGSREDLASKLHHALDIRNTLDTLGCKAKSRVSVERSWEVVGEQLAKIYKEAGA